MNDINKEIRQAIISADLCHAYPKKTTISEFTNYLKYLYDRLSTYARTIVKIKGNSRWVLVYGACSFLKITITHLDSGKQDNDYEEHLAVISNHFSNELWDYAKEDNIDTIIFDTSEAFYLLFNILSKPLS